VRVYECVYVNLHTNITNGYRWLQMVTIGGDLQPGCLVDQLLTVEPVKVRG